MKKLKRFWIVVLVLGVFVSETHAQATRQVTINGQVVTIVDRQILAKVRADVSDSALSVFLSTNGAVAISRAQRNRRWVLIQTPSNRDVMTLREQWRRVPFFEKVGVNEVGGPAVEPNDPYYAGSLPPPNDYNHQWALKNIGQNPPSGLADADLDAEEAWDIEQGSAKLRFMQM